jgi:putative endonuclease
MTENVQKNHNQTIGQLGEDIAVKYLESKKYKIVERNLKISYKELDIVAYEGNTLVFVEVKTRSSQRFGGAEEALFPKKSYQFKRAAEFYLDRHGIDTEDFRIDFISVDIKADRTADIRHHKDYCF